MQQQPATPATPGTTSFTFSSRNIFILAGIAGVAAVGLVSLSAWFGQKTIKRKKGRAQKKAGGNSLEALARLTPAQLDELLATAAALGDKDLQHKIYFLKGTNNLAEISQSEGAVTRHVLESLFENFHNALGFAEELQSELRSPISLELGSLYYSLQAFDKATQHMERGLSLTLEELLDNGEADESVLRNLLHVYTMLCDSYQEQNKQRQGISYLEDQLNQLRSHQGFNILRNSLLILQSQLQMDIGQHLNSITQLESLMDVSTPATTRLEATKLLLLSYDKLENKAEKREHLSNTVERALAALDELSPDTRSDSQGIYRRYCYSIGAACSYTGYRLETARELLEKAYSATIATPRSTVPPHDEVGLELAEVYTKLKQREKAIRVIDSLLPSLQGKSSTLTLTLMRKAKLCSEMGNKQAAVEALEEARENTKREGIRKTPEDTVMWTMSFLEFQLGKMYTLMGQLQKARSFLNAAEPGAAVKNPVFEFRPMLIATLASNLAQAGEKQDALKKVDQVLNLVKEGGLPHLNDADVNIELGECHLFLGDYLKAKECFELALQKTEEEKAKTDKEKNQLLLQIRLAAVYDWLGETDRALEFLVLAAQSRDQDPSTIHQGSVASGYALHYLTVGEVAKAHEYALEAARYVDQACLGGTPLNVLFLHGLLAETFFWCGSMELASQNFQLCAERTNQSQENIISRLNVLTRLAALALHMENKHQDVTALGMLETILPLARERGSLSHVAQILALIGLARARMDTNDKDQAMAAATSLFVGALSAAEEAGDSRVIAFVSRLAGSFYAHHADQTAEGKNHFHRALKLARDLKDQLLEGLVLRDLAMMADTEQTEADGLLRALEIAQNTGNKYLADLLSPLAPKQGLVETQASVSIEAQKQEEPNLDAAPSPQEKNGEEKHPEERASEVEEEKGENIKAKAPETTEEKYEEKVPETMEEKHEEKAPETMEEKHEDEKAPEAKEEKREEDAKTLETEEQKRHEEKAEATETNEEEKREEKAAETNQEEENVAQEEEKQLESEETPEESSPQEKEDTLE